MKTKNTLSFEAFESALKTLDDATSAPPKSELERDGVIQRFEYTFETAWKAIRATLAALGRADLSGSPRPILRDAHQEGWISDIDAWFRFLDARNESSHEYHAMTAQEVHEVAREFPAEARGLLAALKKAVAE